MKINTLLLTAIITGVLAISGCAAETMPSPVPADPAVSQPAPAVDLPEMTLEELSKFNGKDGAKAYIAVDGVIYDVSEVAPWKTGTHQSKVEAGTDGSDMIGLSPHGKKVLEKLPVVGKLKE